MNIGGTLIEFVDTAGVRHDPEGPIEEEGIQRSKEAIKVKLKPLSADATAVQGLMWAQVNFYLLNKSDLLEGKFSNEDNTFYLSCSTGKGVEELIKAVIAKLGIDGGRNCIFVQTKT